MRALFAPRLLPIALIPLVAATACGSASPENGDAETSCEPTTPIDGRPAWVATTVAPITSIVSVVAAGSGIEIDGVVPEGVNSHLYEPSPSAAATIERADVVFLNGLDLEAPTKQLALANVGADGVVCELGNEILPEADYLYDFSFPESAGSPNPHLWTNPPMARAYAAVIRDVLTAIAPDHADTFAANDEAFAARVDELDAAIRSAGQSLAAEERLLLTYHDAYAYFAKEYDWTVVGAIQPSSFNEPTPREVAALIEQVRDVGVAAIFGSEVFPSPVLRQIADETGVEYVDDLRDDDLPGDPGDEDHSWLGLMQVNMVTIVESLGGDASTIADLDVRPVNADTATYAQ
jgi:ABC-type Zn uptake system ZnuABC Zn-binding protein ZnuA